MAGSSALFKRATAGCDDFDTKPVEMSRLLEKNQSAKISLNTLDRKYRCELLLHCGNPLLAHSCPKPMQRNVRSW